MSMDTRIRASNGDTTMDTNGETTEHKITEQGRETEGIHKAFHTATMAIQSTALGTDKKGYHSNFLTLDKMLAHVHKHLHANQIVMYALQSVDEHLAGQYKFIFRHEDGSSVQTTPIAGVQRLRADTAQNEMWNHGKASTYGLRYALGRFFAICMDQDTDGYLGEEPDVESQVTEKRRLYDLVSSGLTTGYGVNPADVNAMVGKAVKEHGIIAPKTDADIEDFVANVAACAGITT